MEKPFPESLALSHTSCSLLRRLSVVEYGLPAGVECVGSAVPWHADALRLEVGLP